MAEEIIVTVDDTQETVSLFVDVGGAAAVDSFNTRTGVVSPTTGDYNTSQVTEVTNLYYTEARVSANSAVVLNTNKVGITPTQASDITTNNSKISYTDATAVGLNTAKVGITTQQATDITTNNSKVGVTNEEVNTINTELEAGMTGEDLVLNVISLTTAEHTAGTPVATTLYLITDA